MKTVSLLATNKAPAIKCNDFFQSIVKAAVPCSQCAFCQKNFCCNPKSGSPDYVMLEPINI